MAGFLSNRSALAALVALNAEQASGVPLLRDEMQDLRRRLNEIEGSRNPVVKSYRYHGKTYRADRYEKQRAKAKAARKARKITRRNRK